MTESPEKLPLIPGFAGFFGAYDVEREFFEFANFWIAALGEKC
jgi:hypothetical protein